MNSTKSVFINSIIYTFGNILLKAFSFFLIPLYTSHLSTEEYGVINLASGFYTLAAALLTLSLQTAVVRYYADCKDDPGKVRRLFGTAITFMLLVCAGFGAVCFLGRDLVSRTLFEGVAFFPVVLLSVVISVVSGLYSAYQEILKGMQQAKKSMLLSYLFFFLMLGGNILGVVVLDWKANGVLVSTLVTNAVMVAVMFIDLTREGQFALCLDGKVLRQLLGYSLPLVPHTLAYNISTYASKLIINKYLSLAALGVYSLASQLGMIADVVLNSVQNAFLPWMFESMNEGPEGQKRMRRVSYSLVWVYGLVFVGLGAFSKEVILIMADSSYSDAWRYVPAIVFSMTLKCPQYFINSYFYYHKDKTRFIFPSTVAFCVANVVLSLWLIPRLGIYGSVLADILAMVVRTGILAFIMKREAPDFFSISRLVLTCLVSGVFQAAAVAPSLLSGENRLSWGDFLYKGAVVILYAALMLFANHKVIRNDILQMNKKEG